jgi:hypothetical protein
LTISNHHHHHGLETMASIVETSRCEGDELVLILTHCLPPDLERLWHTTDDILAMLRDGGITSYTNKKRISNLLRTQKRIMLEPNRTNAKYWYCFKDDKEFDTPSQQLVAVKEKERPQIEPNYFTNLGITFKFIGTNKTQTATSTIKSTANNNNNRSSNSNNNASGNNNNTSDAATTILIKITTNQRNKVKQATRLSPRHRGLCFQGLTYLKIF